MINFFKPSGAVGLELDTGAIRVLELKNKGKSVYPAAVELIEIPGNAVVEGTIDDVDAVTDALVQLWSKARISNREVVLGLSNQGIIMRTARFPKQVEKKLDQVLRFQAEDLFPIPISELVVDYSVVGEAGTDGSQIELLLVGARRNMLDNCLQALAGAGLTPVVIETSFLALTRLLDKKQVTESVVVVDITNGNCTLVLVDRGIPRFARFIPHSVQPFGSETELPLEYLEKAVKQAAATTDEQQAPGFDPAGHWYAELAGEIRNSVGYYVSRHDEIDISSLLISGRGARLPGLREYLQQQFNVPVDRIEPAKIINTRGGSPPPGAGDWPDYAVCTGLALRGLEG